MAERGRSERVVASVTTGAVVAVLEVVVAVSFAALIFGGSLAGRVADGIGLFIAGAALLLVILAWRTGGRGIVGSVQDGPAAVLAVVAASAAASAAGGRDAEFATVVVVVALATMATGLVCLLLGAFRLGNVVRFVPYPVVGGFLAGTGWLLAKGGVAVASGVSPALRTLDDLATGDALGRWAPALAFAVGLLLATRLIRRPIVIPAALGVAVVLFAIGIVVTGSTLAEAEAGGWLIGPFPDAGIWGPWTVRSLGAADWGTVFEQAGGITTAVFVGVIATLLNATGLELMLRRDLDSNEELRASGLTNLVAGAIGSLPGFHAPSLTSLARHSRAPARPVGMIAAALTLGTLLFGVAVVALIPRMLLGGLLLFIGLSFLVEWVVDARSEMPRGEHALVIAILAAIVAWGLLAGVAVGLVLAVVLFAVSYSRTQLVQEGTLGTAHHSNVERPPGEREALVAAGAQVSILRLSGFVFFGTASGVLDRVRERVARGPLRFLVVDFRRVTGVDSSAALSFVKIAQLAATNEFEVVLTAVPPAVLARFERAGVRGDGASVHVEVDLDRGLERCEEALLRAGPAPTPDLWAAGDATTLRRRLEPYLERLELEAGQILIRQGDPPDDVFLLESGRLSVVMRSADGGRMRLRTMRPGIVVGEISLYTAERRTADVVAEAPSTVLRLGRDVLERIERDEPGLAAAVHRWFAAVLAERLGYSLRALDAQGD